MDQAKAGELVKLEDTGKTVADRNEDIPGYIVRTASGEEIGKVDELLIDAAEEKVRFLIVASGGLQGIGKDKTFIPVDAVKSINEGELKFSSAPPGTRLPEPRNTIRTSPKPDPTTRGCTATTAFRPIGARATPIPYTPTIPAEATPAHQVLAGARSRKEKRAPVNRCSIELSWPITGRSDLPDPRPPTTPDLKS